jgi:hypothetical protein
MPCEYVPLAHRAAALEAALEAAPEVLEALKYFVHQMDSFRDRNGNQEDAYYHFAKCHDAAWERARAAIAKAEGLEMLADGVGAGS